MPKIIYTCTPPPGMRNVGDQAQAVCIHRWLARHWPGRQVLEFHKKVPIAQIEAATEPGDLIFIHSGGNMCNRGMGMSEPARRAVVKAFPDHTIISLPQTIALTGKALEGAKRVYNAHPDLTILARDVLSYNLALRHFPACRNALCPDFVLGYEYEPPGRERSGALFVLRSDQESILGREGRRRLAEQYGGTLADTNAPRNVPPERREAELRAMLDWFAVYKCVVTDRLHGVIFAILARTPVVVLPTVDHKLTACWWWFKDMPQVSFAEGRDLADCMMGARFMPPFVLPDWHGEWFEGLAGWLKGKSDVFGLGNTIAARRSRRRWLKEPVAQSLLKMVVRGGVHAPSGANAQCVRFRIITDREAIARICRAKYHNGFKDNHPPAIILVGYDYGVPGTVLYEKKCTRWLPLAYQDVAAAMQNMCLTAESVGLAACWVSVFSGNVTAVPEIKPAGTVEWLSALFVGYGDKPWLVDEKHAGRPVARKGLSYYLLE